MKINNIEISSQELSLIMEALKFKIKHIEEERFYRHYESDGFYLVHLEERWRLLNKLANIPIAKNTLKPIKFSSQKPKN